MKKYIPVLKKTKLFAGVGEEDIFAMLGCLQAKMQTYYKGQYVLRQGEYVSHIMILLDGSLHICRDDYWGNTSIIDSVGIGSMFAQAYAAPDGGALPHDVVAKEDSTVILFDVMRLLTLCPSACRFHSMAVQNLYYAISENNRKLMQKLGHISKRTTREKLLSYLSGQAAMQGCNEFTIPFNRQQLADYLSVDRSAMSNELCKMRNEGILYFDKNRFILKQANGKEQ